MDQFSLPEHAQTANDAHEQKTWQKISAGTWTVAVDLSTNLEEPLGKSSGAGAKDKWAKLQQLAGETASSSVQFVVSVASHDAVAHTDETGSSDFSGANRPNMPSANSTRKSNESENADNVSRLSVPNLFKVNPADTRIDTYLVADGKIEAIASQRSQGAAADIQALLSTAGGVAPSEHLGLVIFAHGTGVDASGIQSDSGQATLSAVHDAIVNGLGQRDKLDTLVFDGCLMSTTETANKMQGVSKTLVASADHEMALMDKGMDAITLNKPLQDLLQAPNMSAKEFAMAFIDEARKGANGIPGKTPYDHNHLRSSVDTLLALDLTKYGQFENSLNSLGKAIDQTLAISDNKKVVADAVKATPSFPSLASYYNNTQRDTERFATRILENIRQGKLLDPAGNVSRAAKTLLQDQHDMSLGYYGSSKYYQQLGGITAELPVAETASQRHAAWESGFPGDLLKYSHLLEDFQFHDALSQISAQELSLLKLIPRKSQSDNFHKLIDAGTEINDAANQSQYSAAIAKLRSALTGYLTEADCKPLIDQILQKRDYSPSSVTGRDWEQFVGDLANYDRVHNQTVPLK
jgi:hypothetical protein